MAIFTAPRTIPMLPRSASRGERWSTPRQLQALMALTGTITMLLVIAALFARYQVYSAVKTVGRDAAPSILAAQDVRARLASMDANAALDLLGGPTGIPTARTAFDADRQGAVNRLIDAAQNITYGDAERIPIQTINQQMGQYLQLIAEARLLHQQNPADANALARYRQATDLMHATIIPAAQALDEVNQQHLDQAYAANGRSTAIFQALVYAAVLALLATLIGTQVFVARRTHRLLNLPLALASLLVLIAVLFINHTFTVAAYDLTVAKPDAFDSLGTLSRARSAMYDARGDQARFLLDPTRTAQYDQAFRDKTATVVSVPITDALVVTTDRNVQDVTSTAQGVLAATHDAVPFVGYLATELNNITFVGEKAAAMSTLRADAQFLITDAQIRTLERAGRHADAVALCIGAGDTDAGGQLARFDTALGQTITINAQQFQDAIIRGFADLAFVPVATPIIALLIALLAFAGIQARLREYHV